MRDERGDVPLVVDLDGTLVKTDLFWESALRLLARRPWQLFLFPSWLAGGRHIIKDHVASRISIDAASLPYNQEVLAFLRDERSRGRRLILATGSHTSLARAVEDHLGLFEEVYTSDGQTNLRGEAKAAKLVAHFGEKGFDYVGNDASDIPVWRSARLAFSVGRSWREIPDATILSPERSHLTATVRLLRPHHWLKNLILFVPALTAHRLDEPRIVGLTAIAALAFSLCSSGMYVLNDLLDLDADRLHERKRTRPLADGSLPLLWGVALALLLTIAGGALALLLPPTFQLTLAGYVILTSAYSLGLKQIVLLDVFCLAGLYTIRLVGGHEATGVAYSSWLLMFSMFVFLSLALAKRFQELQVLRRINLSQAKRRGYYVSDVDLLAGFGLCSGYMAILVLGLYVNSDQVQTLYRHPERLLLICPLMLYWVSRIWLVAHRGELPDDPVVFALRDLTSYGIGAAILAVIWLATGF